MGTIAAVMFRQMRGMGEWRLFVTASHVFKGLGGGSKGKGGMGGIFGVGKANPTIIAKENRVTLRTLSNKT